MSGLPDGRRFFRRYAVCVGAISAASVVAVTLYLLALLRLSPAQREGLVWVLAVAFPLLFALSSWTNRRFFLPLLEVLDRAARSQGTRADALRGFATAVNLPALQFVSGLGWWVVGGLVVATAMRLGFGAAFPWISWVALVAAAVSGGLVSTLFTFYVTKQLLAPIREALALELPDPAERGRLVRGIPLARKLLVAMGGGMVVTLGFALLVAHTQAQRSLEAFANRVHAELLDETAAALDAGEDPWAATGGPAARALGARLLLLDPADATVRRGPSDALLAEERATLLRLGDRGDSTSFDSPNAFAWRRLAGGGGILVAVAAPEVLAADAGRPWATLGLLTLLSLALAGAIARLAAADVGQVTDRLAVEVERMAAGDLTGGHVLESEDELGELARRFEGMAGVLRGTVRRVAEAAEGVEQTATEIAGVAAELGGATSDQVQGIDSVTASMGRIQGEVGGIAESAHALSVSVEESSSSMLELGVTSEQLDQNATVLSERVAEVSGSIEQMMRSSRQVLASIEELVEASAETSSSMEEMASSMREVDANAAETARLSNHVVEIADVGRRQVEQTIRGMEAIQEATDVARGVIHGLGQRTGEIGTILEVIDDVADETNLLALNAAIIAAQAGEHGRAFSVVADEIKDLADKVLASTKEIGTLIRAVQDEAGNAVGAIETGARSVETGVELSGEAGVALERITSASRESGERIGEIVSAVREQSSAAAHVVGLMERVREGAARIRTAGTEQAQGNEVVLAGASAMREVAQQVNGATQEQARGSQRMRESIENVRSVVEQINHSLHEQSSACRQITEHLERVNARTGANEEAARRMHDAMRGLLERAEGLREGVRHFRV